MEAGALLRVDGVIGCFGGHQVRHHIQHLHAVQQKGRGGQLVHLRGREPQPVHAGVHMQQRGQGTAHGAGVDGPVGDLGQRPEHRRDAVGAVSGSIAGPQTVEHGEHGAREQRAERQGFGQVRDEEVAAALGMEMRRDMRRAKAVGVGF